MIQRALQWKKFYSVPSVNHFACPARNRLLPRSLPSAVDKDGGETQDGGEPGVPNVDVLVICNTGQTQTATTSDNWRVH